MSWQTKMQKNATKKTEIDMVISYSKAEVKSIIKEEMRKKWQEEWNMETKARMYYNIQKKVGGMRENNRNKKEEDIISRMRFGHTGLNSTLKIIGKHENGMCEVCNISETIEHVIINCDGYKEERLRLKERLSKEKIRFEMNEILQLNSGHVGYTAIFDYLNKTGLIRKI